MRARPFGSLPAVMPTVLSLREMFSKPWTSTDMTALVSFQDLTQFTRTLLILLPQRNILVAPRRER